MRHISAGKALPPKGTPSSTLLPKHNPAPPPPPPRHVLENIDSRKGAELGPAVVSQPSVLIHKDLKPTAVSIISDADPPSIIPWILKKVRVIIVTSDFGSPTSYALSPLYSTPQSSYDFAPGPSSSSYPDPSPPVSYLSYEPLGPSLNPVPSPPAPYLSYEPLGLLHSPNLSPEYGTGSGESGGPEYNTGSSSTSGHKSNSTAVGAGISVGVVGFILAVLIFVYFFWFRKRQRGTGTINNNEFHASTPPKQVIDTPEKVTDSSQATTSTQSKLVESSGSSVNVSSSSTYPGNKKGRSTDVFTFVEISEATSNFSKDNVLGKGGFGEVYKGVLSSGKPVAIKQLKAGSHQGEREFMAEIEIISHIHHKNLVSLVGYSVQGTQRLLVYEFMANNSLAYHLHAPEAETLAWETRMQIAIGSAKGLAYLHEDCEPKIIHRDIKATNILLDSNFKAKVSDFGVAKFVAECETHITTRVMGTFGYLAPEYASSGKLTDKSDVYSFGVVLLELISGRQAIDLIEWARTLLPIAIEYDVYDELVDPKLEKQYNNVEMRRMVASAWACIQPYAQDRPQMIEIARILEGVMSTDDLKAKAKEYSANAFNKLKQDPRVAGR